MSKMAGVGIMKTMCRKGHQMAVSASSCKTVVREE